MDKLAIIALMPPKYTVDVILLCGVRKVVVYPCEYSLNNVPLCECTFFNTWAELEEHYQFMKCPHCGGMFEHGKDGYQVNDIFELEFCSFHCSDEYTEQRKEQLLADGYLADEIEAGV